MSALKKNIIFLLGSQLATWMITLILLVLAPRRLDPVGFGNISFATSYIGFFNLIGALGSYPHIVKLIARDHSLVGPMVVSAIRLKLVLSLGLSATAMGLAWALGYSGEVLVLILIGCVGMSMNLLQEMLVAGLAGMERMARSAVWQTAQVYVASIGGIIVLLTTKSLYLFAICFAGAWMIPVVANYINLRPFLRGHGARHPGQWGPLIRGGIPVLVLSVLNLAYSTIDIPILERISGPEEVAWYALAYKWVGMPIFITTIVVTAFLPQLSALAVDSPAEFAKMANRAIKLVMIVNIPASTGLLLVSSDLINFLYEPEYEPSVRLMRILALFIVLVALNTVLAFALIAQDRHKRYVWVAFAATCFNPPLSYLAIRLAEDHDGIGAVGASIITVLTEIFITVCAFRMRSPGVLDRHTMLFVVRCSLAAAAMAPPLLIFHEIGLFTEIAVGLVCYGLGLFVVRILTPSTLREGLQELKRIVSSKTGGRNDPTPEYTPS